MSEPATTSPGAWDRTDRRIVLLLVGALFLLYFFVGIPVSYDSRFSIPVALEIVEHGTTRLDAFPDVPRNDYAVEVVNGHVYSAFPIGTPLLAVPFVAVIDAVASRTLLFSAHGFLAPFRLEDLVKRGAVPVGIELFVASWIVAAAAALIYALARRELARAPALAATLAFALGTSAWSTASRGLWQHGPSMLFLAATLLAIRNARERPWLWALAGATLAYSYVIRPTNSASVIFLTGYVFLRARPQAVRFLAGAAVVAIPFLAYNFSVYGALLAPYYLAKPLKLHSELGWALAGHWLSPSRGLLVYSPFLAFGFHGAIVLWRTGRWTALETALVLAIALHWVAISLCYPWAGGNCYGPRYFSDLLPYFLVFTFPSLARLPALEGARRRVALGAFALAVAASVLIHWRGATSPAVYQWNMDPILVDDAPARRAWDFHDIQFLRGLGK